MSSLLSLVLAAAAHLGFGLGDAMETVQIKASASHPVLKKLEAEEEVVGGRKSSRRKKPRPCDDEVDVDQAQAAELLSKRRKKPKHDHEDHQAHAVVGGKRKRRNSDKKKRDPKHHRHEVEKPTLEEHTEGLVIRELTSYLLCAPSPLPRKSHLGAQTAFGYPFALRLAAYLNGVTELDAGILRQYRTNGIPSGRPGDPNLPHM